VGKYGGEGRPKLMIEVRNDLIDEPAFRAKLIAALLHCVGATGPSRM
jgi:predicted N-formylglutamate amidohydrolase